MPFRLRAQMPVGAVLARRVEQCVEARPAHWASAFTVDMHHQRVDQACLGVNVDLNVRVWASAACLGLGDVTVYTWRKSTQVQGWVDFLRR